MYQVTYQTGKTTKIVLVRATNSREANQYVLESEEYNIEILDIKSFYEGEVFFISEKAR